MFLSPMVCINFRVEQSHIFTCVFMQATRCTMCVCCFCFGRKLCWVEFAGHTLSTVDAVRTFWNQPFALFTLAYPHFPWAKMLPHVIHTSYVFIWLLLIKRTCWFCTSSLQKQIQIRVPYLRRRTVPRKATVKRMALPLWFFAWTKPPCAACLIQQVWRCTCGYFQLEVVCRIIPHCM